MARKRIERTDQIFAESEVVTALFAEREEAVQRSIPVDSLVPNRFNPRENYSKEALGELIQSMQEHGFIGALDGRELPDGRVEVAYGSRRLLAARAAGIRSIPVFLHDWDDQQFRFVSLVENLVREDLTPSEQAETIGQMHEHLGLSVREIARKTGKPKSWVEDRLALYRAPQDVKVMVAARGDALRAANYIARLPDEARRRILEEKVIQEELTTRQIQLAVQQIVEEGVPIERAVASVTAETKPPPAPPARKLSARQQPTVQQAAEEGGPTGEEISPVLPPPPPALDTPGLDTSPATRTGGTRPERKEIAPTEETADASARELSPKYGTLKQERADASSPRLAQERSSVSQFVIQANQALARFDLEAVQDEELNELRNHLRQLVDRASRLLEKVEARLQSA